MHIQELYFCSIQKPLRSNFSFYREVFIMLNEEKIRKEKHIDDGNMIQNDSH